MVGQTTLSVAIDAKEAKKGAADFIRAADDIKRKAAEMDKVVERSKRAFKNMGEVSGQGLDISGPSFGQIDSINEEIKRLEKLRKDSKFLSLLSSVIPGKVADAVGIFTTLGQDSLEERLRTLERTKQIIEDDAAAKEFLQAAVQTSDPGTLKVAERLASERLRNAQTLREQNVAPLLEPLEAQRKLIESFQENSGKNVFLDEFSKFQPQPKFLVEGLRIKEKELAETIAELEARGEAIAFLELEQQSVANLQREPTPNGGRAPRDGAIQRESNDDPIKQQIEDTNRSIDLLKEQQRTLEDNATQSLQQKEKELELLQREKECLERLNELLRENQTLREGAGEQADDISKSAAAYDDLSTAVGQNGEATKELKNEVDSLNTVLESNADINAQIVDGLEKERDARQQVNQEVVERRQLDQDPGQRLIAERKDVSDSAAEVDAAIEQIRNAAKDAFKDVIKGTESVGDAFQKLADRITDILLDLALEELLKGGTGFSDLLGTIFGGIGSVFGGGGASTVADSFARTALAGGFTTFSAGAPDIFHQGGIVGRDGAPRLVAANFNGTPRFHTGGVTGLAPDEIPIIAQRGEEVLTRNDPRHRDNGGLGGGAVGGVVVNVNFPNARNTQEAREAGSEIAANAAAAAQRGMARKGLG